MFILINFGYKNRKIFTIDCLAAVVFDCIWQSCSKQLFEMYNNKELQFKKQIQNNKKIIQIDQKKLQIIKQKFKQQQQNNPDKKKQKDQKKNVKKGSKQPIIASSQIQQEKIDLQKKIQDKKIANQKYAEKREKIQQLKLKLQQIKIKIEKQQAYVEIVDKTGQRKFIKTKLEKQANSFLSDRGIYYLCTVLTVADEQQVDVLTHQGFPVRTVEEDAAVVGQQIIFSVKKEDKGKKGGKKK